MSKPAPRLGRGLSALIGQPPTQSLRHRPAAPAGDAAAENPLEIPIEQIIPNPYQPRSTFDDASLQELAASIRRAGVLQPVLVRPRPDGRFELVAGERRWRAAKLANRTTIPAITRQLTDVEALEIALIENLQREDLKPLERAAAFVAFTEAFHISIDELATRLGQSRANIANYVRLNRLPEQVKSLLESNELGMGQARAIAGITDPQRQLAVARLAVRRNLSVRQVEELAKPGDPVQPPTLAPPQPDGRSRHLDEVQTALSKALGLPVQLEPGRKKNAGRVVITYNSLEEFDRIAERLGGRVTLG
jgi:ParB family chromosome partitioning protein